MNKSTGSLTKRMVMTIEEKRDKMKTKKEPEMSCTKKPIRKAAAITTKMYWSGSSPKTGRKDTLENMKR